METVSQCIYCESVYNVNESNSNVPESCCCKNCEESYKKFLDNLTIE